VRPLWDDRQQVLPDLHERQQQLDDLAQPRLLIG